METPIPSWRISDAFAAAGCIWAAAQEAGDDASVSDAETLATTLRGLKERQDAGPKLVELSPLPAGALVAVADCY